MFSRTDECSYRCLCQRQQTHTLMDIRTYPTLTTQATSGTTQATSGTTATTITTSGQSLL